ncbi:MAG: ABC transporter ATP-binding protein [Conexivisphaerales archaeon]
MPVDHSQPVQVFNLTKRFSYQSKSLQSARRIRGWREFLKFFRVVFGAKERDLLALDNISFEVNSGEIFALLGPNGAGKTTLIKILSTLILQDEGNAYTFGVDIAKHPRRALKYIQTSLAEEVGFERRLTGRQNLELYGDLYGIPKAEAKRRIDELLALTGLEKFADMTYNKYSTGTAKRLVVCRVLLSDAPVLIFDEPTTGLDALAAAEFRKLLKDILVKERGKTIIMSSHNLWEVEQLCNRIAVLNRGRLLALGTADELRNKVSRSIRITLSFDGGQSVSKSVLDSIRQLEGVSDCDVTDIGLVTHRLTLETTPWFDYLKLFEILIAANLKIKSIESEKVSLEDVFVQMTKGAK